MFSYKEINQTKKEKIVHSKKYLDWLVEFTNAQSNKMWDEESITYSNFISNYDKKYAKLLLNFQDELVKLAKEQFVLSLPTNKYEDFKYHFKLRGNFYETTLLNGNGMVSVIKKIECPCESFIYVDEKIPAQVKKERELIEFIIINADLNLSAAQYAVHISHVSTKAALSEFQTEKFKIWYQEGTNQKKILLKTNEKTLEEFEKKFFSSRDTGHNNIKENQLIAVSLGILSRKEAEKYTEKCELWA